MTTTVTFYTRDGCTLCQEALALLEHAARDRDLRIVPVDVDGDPDLHDRYTDIVPVAEVEGEEIFRLHVDPLELRRKLDALTS